MKISDLLTIKNRIKTLSDLKKIEMLTNFSMNTLVDNDVPEIFGNDMRDITIEVMVETAKTFGTFAKRINGLYDKIDNAILTLENELLPLEIPTTYEKMKQLHSANMSSDSKTVLEGRISKYSTWLYPALEIGPRNPVITSKLVASDPLYLVETEFKEVIAEAIKQYTPEYQARLRTYFIDKLDFSVLPQNQFGFVICLNLFNFLPATSIFKYIEAVYPLLLEGGTFLFSFNNGETPDGASRSEEGRQSYVRKSELISLVNAIGYEVTDSFSFNGWDGLTWLEVKKPGTLNTIKGHQALGAIKDIE
jgi:hypothetical protein